MSKKEVLKNENAVQAVLIADNFGDEFLPISDDIPLALLPLVNKPLIEYTLEFLSLGGIEETFLFCCNHVDKIKEYIEKRTAEYADWTLTMKVNVIISESCRSLGDCLRDLDAKALIRNDFVLLEAGVISNIKLLPLIKSHNNTTKSDKGAAMTLIFQECGIGHKSRCQYEEVLLASNAANRILFHKKLGQSRERKIDFPLDIFLENPSVSIQHNLKDTHIAICSASVLPLFSDNFDFQTRDDFIRGLLMNEEILGSTIYNYLVKNSNYGSAITNWRMYQAVSHELKNRWVYPILPLLKRDCFLKKGVVLGKNCSIADDAKITNTIIGHNVKINKNTQIEESFIFSNSIVDENTHIKFSIIGQNCHIKANSKVLSGCVLGEGVVVEKNTFLEDTLVQKTEPEDAEANDKLGEKAYKLRISEDSDDDDIVDVTRRLSRLHFGNDDVIEDEDIDDGISNSEDELSYTESPIQDDTKLFFTEVMDSLTRGFEDELQCDNLILEINSSRYAYNITVKEVNYNVIKAIFHMSLRQQVGAQYLSHLQRLLLYFSPILKNYIRNESAMFDCLQAIEDVVTSNEELNEKWVMYVLNWFYNKDYLTEDVILTWFNKLDKNSNFYNQVKPFTDWLQEAEEASSSEDESS